MPPRVGVALVAAACFAAGCAGACAPRAADPPAAAPAAAPAVTTTSGFGFLKGQLHAHTNRSGDSHTPPLEAARWYAARGYDFVVFTDHNRITEVQGAPLLVFAGVEVTQELETCGPPDPEERCPLHVNALFVDPARADGPLPPASSDRRADVYARGVAIAAQLGGLAQINHPNYHYGAGADLLVALSRQGARFVEIANLAVDSNNEGDAAHPSTEALWDAALTQGATLLGVASDDAHHYDDAVEVAARGEVAHTGDRGFVMVRATRDAAAIRAALARGDFYSSSGVRLAALEVTPAALALAVAPATPGPCEISFIGRGGATLATERGPAARFPLPGAAGGYVRAVVTDAAGARAWTQPVRVP
jgi:hypothetical protein